MIRFLALILAFVITSPALAIDKTFNENEKQEIFKIIADNAEGKMYDHNKIQEFACSVISANSSGCDLEHDEHALEVYKVAENKYVIMAMDVGASFNHMGELILIKKIGAKIVAKSLEDMSYFDAKTKKFTINDAPQGFTNLSYENGLFHAYIVGDSQGFCRRDIYYAFNGKTDKLKVVKITESDECGSEKETVGKVKTVTIYKRK